MERIQSAADRRLFALDVFRGMTIAAMILVNSSGNDLGYKFLAHAPWNGCTFADFVFPAFLIIMGISLSISLGRRVLEGRPASAIVRQIVRRTLIIFALGLLVNLVLIDSATSFRYTGVLQRIAVCYFFAGLLFLGAGVRANALAAVAVALLLVYWGLLEWVPVPGRGPGALTPEGNLASYLDRLILGRHLLWGDHDPEGLLSTMSALATTLIGVLAGVWLGSDRPARQKALGLAAWGAAFALVGWLWSLILPLNKNMWTSSYAVFTSGTALLVLSLCYHLIDVQEIQAWGRPFEIFGRNPLLSYFLSGLFYGVQEFADKRMPDGGMGNLKLWLCSMLFGRLSPANASAAYAVAYLFACWLFMAYLHKRGAFLKI